MKVTKATLEDIKKELKLSVKKDRGFTAKEIIAELSPVIQQQMSGGAKLVDLYEIVRAKLPNETKLSEATFKKYLREAREALERKQAKTSTRKASPKPPVTSPSEADAAQPKEAARPTALDYREDPKDI